MAAALTVRGFRRGNNANNTNLSPLYVNANNAPSNSNTNIAFGKCSAKCNIVYRCRQAAVAQQQTRNKSSIACDLGMKRQVQSQLIPGSKQFLQGEQES